MSFIIVCLAVHILLMTTISVSAATINQRQTGDMNVHVNVKNFKILALMKNSKEDYVDYDYAYDYSEMTIKPQNSTTAKPLNITTTDLSFDNSTDTTDTEILVEITPPSPLKNTSLTPQIETTISPEEKSSTDSASYSLPELTTPAPVLSNITASECKKGFSVNKKGECELKLQNSSTNALLKLVKLSQKLKLRREN